MKTCIITVIKDEHAYLDEWIKYHLDLGIDHLFIFEDIGSKSHAAVTEKYGNKVSLNSVVVAFEGEKTESEVIEFKNTYPYYQNHYFRHGMRYILNTRPNEYDWCFAIDNDEFITLEKQDATLNDVLNIYEGYDAFMVQWKNYGANGYIHRPDYGDVGMVGTYTKEAEGNFTSDAAGYEMGFTKTCYNMHTFDESFFWNVHQPTDKCKWCKSDLRSYRLRPIYNNIFIRHYATKSWEEYVWKLKVRGDILDGNRKFDDFFDLNPEMSDRKDELLAMIDSITEYYNKKNF